MTSLEAGNIFADIERRQQRKRRHQGAFARPGLRIERIVSQGHASPPGFWFDQMQDEWVIVLAGSAELRFEDEAEARLLKVGDYVFIPAGKRHRVDWTSGTQPTVWLAVHFGAAEDVS